MDNMQSSRYLRQTAIPEIGAQGMEKLRAGSVFIVGAGALGSVAAAWLAGAGVGRIGIADFDTIDLTNLQRQVFFSEKDAGRPKVSSLTEHLNSLNSTVSIEVRNELITRKNAPSIFADYDIIVDATDNPASKYMTDDVCEKIGRPCVIGGVERFWGQLSTFLPGSLRYRDLFPDVADEPGLTPCSVAGVIGPAPGIIGNLQASEVIKYLTGAGELLDGRLLTFDLLTNSFRIFDLNL